MTEDIILAGCLNNDVSCQQMLYEKYSPKMLGVCYRFAKNRHDAEDMLQEGFVKIFTQIHQYRNEGSIEGWIRRIIVHTCINALKKNQKNFNCIDISAAYELHSNNDDVLGILQAKEIIELIRKLPIGYRTVLNLYAIEGYSHKEIGVMLDIGESTSRSQYTRAKAMLKNILEKDTAIPKPVKQVV